VTLEHSQPFADQLREKIVMHGLQGFVDLRVAPLDKYQLGEETFEWFARSTISDIANIQILVIDGPPGRLAPLARYPAIPLLMDRLSEGARVFLDDAVRPAEIAIMKRWLAENQCLRESSRIGRNTMEFRVLKP
jgi:hypothetical protein